MNDYLAPLVGNPCSNHYTIGSVKHENNRNVKKIKTTSKKVYCVKSYKLKFKIDKQSEVMNAEYTVADKNSDFKFLENGLKKNVELF